MATVKQRFTPSPAPSNVSITLDGPRPGADEPAREALWLTLRREIARLTTGGPFDPRAVLTLTADALEDWRRSRRAWLAARFKDDPRVEGM